MSTMQDLLRPLRESGTEQPLCPSCGRPMHLTRSMPRAAGLSPLATYRCGECGVSLTEAAVERSAA